MKKTTLIFITLTTCLFSCNIDSKKEQKISQINLQVDFVDFYKQFYAADHKTIKPLKKKYPYLFPTNIDDKEWFEKINGTEGKILLAKTDSVYNNLSKEKDAIIKLFQHIKYYNNRFSPPKTFFLINDLDYEHSVVYSDSLLFISLDMYLGKDSEVYESFPQYLASNYTKEHIIVDISEKIIEQKFQIKRGRGFLESMIFYGKIIYLKQLFLPETEENILLKIEKNKLNWSQNNESEIWKYFITNKLLFSTDNSLNKRFIDEAPFSKFYMEGDSESPGKIGRWIGYKIIQSYAKNNKTSLEDLLLLDAQSILQRSKYKPSK